MEISTKDKKRIRIAISNKKYMPIFEAISYFVADRYEFEFVDDCDADFVFHSSSHYEVLKYSGVRIFGTAEMVSPDFNITDYAIGFDRLQFGDRYLHMPLLRMVRPSYEKILEPRPDATELLAGKEGFCAYVMSNTTNSAPERTRIFDLLTSYKTVSSGGAWRNNTGGRVDDKLAFQSKHKFVIAFENTSFPGYLTEKFSEAVASNAIPIYWGDPDIGEVFNTKAFVNCHDYDSLEEVVDRVKEIDQNDELYKEMISQPLFRGGVEPEAFSEKSYVEFLTNIFDQQPEHAYRRPRGRWGKKYEKFLYIATFKPFEHLLRTLRSRLRG